MQRKPIVWTIAGSDSSGGAGIQADLTVLQNLGVHGCSIITAVTAQNSQTQTINYLTCDEVENQLQALQTDYPPCVIKIGMLGSEKSNEKIFQFLLNTKAKIVLDPILLSSQNIPLFSTSLKKHCAFLKKLFPLCHVVTPNLLEAQHILDCEIKSFADVSNAAKEFLQLGAKHVVIKGGHALDDTFSQDYWTDGTDHFWLAHPRIQGHSCRGTGCTFSSALAAALALQYVIKDALVIAKMYINRGIRLSHTVNPRIALLQHANWPEEEIDLPYLSPTPMKEIPRVFKHATLGLYPIVDSLEWLHKLLNLGVKTIQLRIKNQKLSVLKDIFKSAIHLAKQHHANLYINDYWELALELQAFGVHLGQEDLQQADIETLHAANIHLGISTHCYYEVARAHTLRPSYLACGPIFPTTSKMMAFPAQGITQLQRWRKTLHYPLVAIGGINETNIASILKTNVEGIAMISAITTAPDPHHTTLHFLRMIEQHATQRT